MTDYTSLISGRSFGKPLLDALRPLIQRPLTRLGEAAVEAYERLPGIAGWTPPPDIQPADVHRIIECGWPLAVLGPNVSLNLLLEKGDSSDLISVLHSGALLTHLGASVEFIKEVKCLRTPDIRASWGSELTDVEVTTPLIKPQQEELQSIMDVLGQVIGHDSGAGHLLIHLAGIPTQAVQSKIINAVITLRSDERDGTENEWEVAVIPVDRGDNLVDQTAIESLRPVWWGNEGPTLINSSITICPPEIDRRILLYSKIPFLSYLNSIRSKIDRPQCDPNNPYLVIIDQPFMPLGHGQLEVELEPWWHQWDHLSGVLCFDRRAYFYNRFCWKLSFHPNPHANRPLPEPLRSLAPQDRDACVEMFR